MLDRDKVLAVAEKAAHDARCGFHPPGGELMGHHGVMISVEADVAAVTPVVAGAVTGELRTLHTRVAETFSVSSLDGPVTFRFHCGHCGTFYTWPCPTVQLLDQIDAVLGVGGKEE